MRIIAGKKRGMKLLSPKTQVSRPIIDRVKESVFSILLKFDVPNGKIAADLFSGVGSVTFVENDPEVLAVLKRNIEKADFVEESKVVRTNAFKVGAPVDFGGQKYDIVFVDPPYPTTADVSADSPLGGLLVLLEEQLALHGIVVVRTNKRTNLLERYGRLGVIDRREWGTMAVTILKKLADDE